MTSSNPYQPPPPVGDDRRPQEILAEVEYGQPTNVRWGVLGFAFTMSLLLYLDRYALTLAGPPIMDELGLSKEQYGIATGAFFYIYALAQVPAGWLSDRWGSRLTLGAYVVLWSFALGATAFIGGLASLVVFRGLLGLAQAGAYPCIASTIKRWFPPQRRGVANSLTSMGGRAGFLLNTLITPLLMATLGAVVGWATGQWRIVFVVYATFGLVWALGFWWWFRDSPDEHPACNDDERRLIGHVALTTPDGVRQSAGWPPMLAMAKSSTIYFLCGVSVFVNVGWIFLVTFLPTYLNKVHGFDLAQAGYLAFVPAIASMCGGVTGGLSTDALVRRIGLTWGRRATGLVATVGAGLAYVGAYFTDHPYVHIALFAAAGFLIDFGLGALWAVYQDIAGKHVASVLGFGNMCGNLAAGVFPQIIGRYADNNDWKTVFAISAGALFVTAACWLFVRPGVPLERDA